MKFSTWLRAEWDRVAGFGLVGLGAIFVLLGYLGVRNTPFVAEQMAYMASGGIGGLFCLGFGAGLLLTADLHDEWRKLDRLEAELRGDAIPEPDLVALTRPAGGTRQAIAVVALILLLPLSIAGAGWHRASQTAELDVAARGLGWAVAAVALGMVVIALWALWMRTSVLRRRTVVTLGLRRSTRNRLAVTEEARPRPDTDENARFVASGHRRFHRAGCPMLEWIEAVPVTRDRLEAELSACGLCDTP